MVELEVQILALEREGLLGEVGRAITASGMLLLRHRLADDRHGALLTLLVRGQPRSKRTLDAALGGNERVVSYRIEPAEGDTMRPHFAASRQTDYVPPPAPPAPPAAGRHVLGGPPMPPPPKVPDVEATAFFGGVPARPAEPEVIEPLPSLDIEADIPWEAWPAPMTLPSPRRPGPPPAPPAAVEAPSLEPDLVAVDRLMRLLPGVYPAALPLVRAMEQAVVPGARQASLSLAGVRVGRWIADRQGVAGSLLRPGEALSKRGLPALGELLDARLQGGQIHLGESPLCGTPGRSGCVFYAGVLHGAMDPQADESAAQAHVIGLCCRALGADECVLAVAD
ncbi:MAG: hypothetical protein KGN77_05325 [Xanthomonadaceae bacterium]|nr:hypothetical protein [Xanthomonadaceae bacterium]MDE1963332.1 hypothetical protein [Xanthomonadaceae bacterium]